MHIPEFMPDLRLGTGETPLDGGCVMQVTHYLWNGGWSDEPECVDPNLMALAISINDSVTPSPRRMLMRAIPDLMGTAYITSTAETHEKTLQFAERTFAYTDNAQEYLDGMRQFVECECASCAEKTAMKKKAAGRLHTDKLTLTDVMHAAVAAAYGQGRIGDDDTEREEYELVNWFVEYVKTWRAIRLVDSDAVDSEPWQPTDEQWRSVAKAMGSKQLTGAAAE